MNMDLILDAIIAVSGIYLAFSAVRSKQTMTLTGGMMVSKNIDLNHAKDIPGFINYMFPITLFVGIAIFACGVLGLVNDLYHMMTQIQLGMTIVFFIMVVAYGILTSKAQKKYLIP